MFIKNRPKITIEKTEFDRLLDWINIILLIVYLTYVYMHYQHLPEIIPTHFGPDGVADNFGTKNSIWILPIIALVMTIGMRILYNYPHQFNYVVKITEENAPRQYQFGIWVLRITTLFVLLLFFYISYATIRTALHNDENALGGWFLPIVLIVSIIFPLYILIKMSSLK